MLDLLQPALAGFALGGGLIVAIGAQNAYLLRMGAAHQHPTLLAFVAALVDSLLIACGLAGLGAVIQAHPQFAAVLRYGGAAFLAWYALQAARRAMTVEALDTGARQVPAVDARRAVLTLLGFSLLNPHVYLDTVVLVGAVGAQHVGSARWAFGIGACTASFVWFFALTHGARLLAPVLARPRAWRVLDGLIAMTMAVLALMLLFN